MEKEKTLELHTRWGGTEQVKIEINNYMNNSGLYIGLFGKTEGYFEPYGDITVNLGVRTPDYCAFIDLNNMPELEKFIEDNELGEFTGLTKESGFCEYPLYMFNVDKLRELAPEGIERYERSTGNDKKLETKQIAR